MTPFAYHRAASTDEALSTEPGTTLIAGGTNLVALMHLGIETPRRLVDLNGVGGAADPFSAITEQPDGSLRIGALVRNATLAAHPLVVARYPVLSRALLEGAPAQSRNRATTAGNLLQRTRCPYFLDLAMTCNKRVAGSGCSAQGGLTRNLGILGISDACLATHPSDMAVALCVLDATVQTRLPDAAPATAVAGAKPAILGRSIAIADFHLLPGDTPQVETILQPGELITSITLPPPAAGAQRYRKVRDRAAFSFALVSVGVVLQMRQATVARVALALGGVAPKPWRLPAAEAKLVGQPLSDQALDGFCDALLAGARGSATGNAADPHRLDDANDFKIPLARRMIIATLRDAAMQG